MSRAIPEWRRGDAVRLRKSMALAAVLMAALLLVDFAEEGRDQAAIEVLLVRPEPAVVEPAAAPEPKPTTQAVSPPDADVEALTPSPVAEDSDDPVAYWYAQIDAAVVSTLDRQAEALSVNPGFDQKRREAAAKFAPSRAPRVVPVWENVETDQLGRKILVSGDCFRVIDDPSAVNYEALRTFHQHIVYCATYRRPARELPWVAGLRDRYDYLGRDGNGGASPTGQVAASLR